MPEGSRRAAEAVRDSDMTAPIHDFRDTNDLRDSQTLLSHESLLSTPIARRVPKLSSSVTSD
jgi:hypothetical protein